MFKTAASGRHTGRLFWVLFLINVSVSLCVSMFDTFLPLHLINKGISGCLLGLTLSAYAAAKIVSGPFLGRYADRTGSRAALSLSISVLAAAGIIYSLSSAAAAVIAARILQGIACALFRPVLFLYLGSLADDTNRASCMGTFDISFYSSAGAGPVLGGVVKDHFGFSGITAMMIVLCLLAQALAVMTSDIKAHAEENTTCTSFVKPCGRPLYALNAFIAGRACAISMTCAFMPVLLTGSHNFSGAAAGSVMTVSTLFMAAFIRPAGRLADRFSYFRLIITGGTAVSAAYFAVPFIGSLAEFTVLFAGIGFFSALSQPAASSMLISEGRKSGLCSAVAMFNSFMNLGFVLGPVLGAVIMSAYGPESVFTAAGIISTVSLGCFVMIIGLHQHKEAADAVY